MKLILLVCAMSLSITSFAQNQKQATTNQDVIDMVKAQLSTELIIKQIQTANAVNFDTSPQDIIKLKHSGVEEKIIMVMLETSRTKEGQNVSTYGPAIKEASAESAVKPKKMIVQAKSFTFELDECRLSGDVITCELMVTSHTRESRRLGFAYVSTMVDDQGNERAATQKNIGGTDTNYSTLSDGTAVRARLDFERIQKAPKVVKLLRLSLNTPALIGGRRIAGGGNFQVELRTFLWPNRHCHMRLSIVSPRLFSFGTDASVAAKA